MHVKRVWIPGKPGDVCQFGDLDDEDDTYDDSEPQSFSQSFHSAQRPPLNSTPRATVDLD
jgi:hypothetical protein